jgi:GNAT superfamily N-acetyltransferase
LPIVTIAAVTPPIYRRTVQIRELRDADIAGVVRLLTDASPHQLLSEQGFRHRLASEPPETKRRRWVAVDGGEIVATAGGQLLPYVEDAPTGAGGVTVRADRRGRGLGGELFEIVLAHARAIGAHRLLAEAAGDAGRTFLEHRGFEAKQTRRYSRVDPREVDLSGLAGLRAGKAAEGFEVVPLADCRPEDVYAVDMATTVDVPVAFQFAEMPLDDWVAQFWSNPQLRHDGSFAVAHEGRPVTITLLRSEGDRAMNDMTGTLREFRGRGLARLLKLHQLEWAARDGLVSVMTENDARNAPMLAVNARLGYRPFLELTTYAREPV